MSLPEWKSRTTIGYRKYGLIIKYIGALALLFVIMVKLRHLDSPVVKTTQSFQHHSLSFDDFGRERVLEYLDVCAETGTIPRLVWTFWFGDNFSENRRRALISMEEILEVPVILVDSSNITEFLRWPVHPAFEYLSGIHKSDYLRIYFLLHYGGGYSDIKHMVESWGKHFNAFDDPNVWIVGVPEIPGPDGVAARPGIVYPDDYYKSMISNGFMIARANNRLLQEVQELQHEVLDKHAQALREHPPPTPRCCMRHEGGYPLRWAELLGENMAIAAGRYIGHLSQSMLMPSLENYI